MSADPKFPTRLVKLKRPSGEIPEGREVFAGLLPVYMSSATATPHMATAGMKIV
jgi:hypothetical protein